jgi:myo-inositol-1(or 4)-monophosphatase
LNDYNQALAAALEAARAAVAVHGAQLGRVQQEEWSEKGVADFVTRVDREAEARVVEVIRRRFPDHDILAEEAASDGHEPARTSDYLWVVDPLDGTTNFLHQYPMYCASVALLHNARPVAGAVVCGPTGEEWSAKEWSASSGGGAFRNGTRIRVSGNDRLPRTLIGTGFPFKKPEVFEQYLEQFRAIAPNVSDIRRGGSAALDLCHVASGWFDGFWELDLRPWDYAAGVLMIREAGGTVTGVDGKEPDWVTGGGIVAGNAAVYRFLMDTLCT